MDFITTNNITQFPTPNKEVTQYFLGKKPKGRFPSGTVPARAVKVDVAVGMYQFHDLLSSHVHPLDKKHSPRLVYPYNDNNNNTFGFINMG